MSLPNEPTQPQEPQQPGSPYPGQQPYQPAPGTPYGQPQNQYGAAQYNPYQAGNAPQRPVAYDSLLKLTMISLVVYVINQGLGIVLNMQDPTGTADTYPGAYLGGAIFGLSLGVLVYILVLNGLKKVKGWARVLGIVLAIIYVLISLLGVLAIAIGGALGVIAGLISLVAVVVNIMWLIKAFNGQTAAYFAAHKTV